MGHAISSSFLRQRNTNLILEVRDMYNTQLAYQVRHVDDTHLTRNLLEALSSIAHVLHDALLYVVASGPVTNTDHTDSKSRG